MMPGNGFFDVFSMDLLIFETSDSSLEDVDPFWGDEYFDSIFPANINAPMDVDEGLKLKFHAILIFD